MNDKFNIREVYKSFDKKISLGEIMWIKNDKAYISIQLDTFVDGTYKYDPRTDELKSTLDKNGINYEYSRASNGATFLIQESK